VTVVNPYAGNPSPSRPDAWGRGWLGGFADPSLGIEPPADLENPDDADVYSEGVQAGRQAAIDGIPPDQVCIAAAEPSPGETFEHMVTGAETLHAAWEIFRLGKLAAGVAGLVVVLIEVGSSGKHTLPPEQVLPGVASPLLETMQDYGFSNIEVFCGAGLDPLAEDCEIQLTNMYSSLSSARDATVRLGRSEWVVVSWRTDQCGSFQVSESS
jgi:hypothetical protein